MDGIRLDWNSEIDHAKTWKLVKSINRGKKYEPKPLRRVYIPKPDGTKRNLGIPTHFDRLYQAILTPAIETVVEMLVNKHELNTFGFRPKIRAADAIGCLHSYAWKGSKALVLDMDMEKCFDQINHSYILKLTDKFGLSHYKHHINQMLQSGFIDIDGSFHETETGTPQGGVISPALANLVLRNTLDIPLATLHLKNIDTINCVSYADDAVIVMRPNHYPTPEKLEKAMSTLKATITENLNPAGLRIKEAKTRTIMDSSPFNFLGFEIGRGRGIIPAKSKLKAAIHRINGLVRQGSRIKYINSVIGGFERYYSHFSSARMWKQIGKLDWYVSRMVWKRRTEKELQCLIRFSDIPKTTKYISPKKGNSYLADSAFFTKRTWSDNPRKKSLYKKQAGICPICKCKMENEPSTLQVHHIHSKAYGGKDKNSNVQLIHESCHLSLHYHQYEDKV